MGAEDFPQDTESQLLRQAIDSGLGFPESQLCRAIKQLVKTFGSSEEACKWIVQDNFTILVNYILDNTDVIYKECQQSPEKMQVEGKKMKKKELNEVENAGQEVRPDGCFPFLKKVYPVEATNDPEPPQKIRRVDRNAFRLHHQRKVMERVPLDLPLDVVEGKSEHTREGSEPPVVKQGGGVPLMVASSSKGHRKRGPDVNGILIPLKPSKKTLRLAEVQDRKGPPMKKGCLDVEVGDGSNVISGLKASELACTGLSQKLAPSLSPEKRARTRVAEAICSALIDAEGYENQTTKRTKTSTSEVSCTASMEDANEEGNQNASVCDWKTKKGRRNTSVGASCSGASMETANEEGNQNASVCDQKTKKDCRNISVGASCSAAIEASNKEGTLYPTVCDLELQLKAFLEANNCEKALEVFRAWSHQGFKKETNDGPRQLGMNRFQSFLGRNAVLWSAMILAEACRETSPISCVNEYNSEMLPDNYLYIRKSEIRAAAHIDTSLSRIGDLHCCCSDDCLRSPEACKCTDSTRGEYAYDQDGRLIERLATAFRSGCTTQNGDFITECCTKCRCSMSCGNRIVQRGITRKIQVFMTPTKKGWGVRALEKIPARAFLFEYLGEIATNEEQYYRNEEYAKTGEHTYSMNLDADLDMEKNHFGDGLSDTEALVLDAARFGNVSRFVNHRCNDANLFMRPVQIETRDTHYYHAAFFAARDIEEMEELTWDYGIDFEDQAHQLEAFICRCKSPTCRDKRSPYSSHDKVKRGQALKPSQLKKSCKDDKL